MPAEIAEETISLHELRGDGERILLVEDDVRVREFASRVLDENGYAIFQASNVEEAIDTYKKEQGNFRLIFSDVVLPGGSGLELADKLLSRNSGLGVLLTSGYVNKKSQWDHIRKKGFFFLQKPYTLLDLLRIMKEIMASGHEPKS